MNSKILETNYIGNKLNYLRKSKKLTLSQLADITNSSAGFLSDIEKGKTLPSIPKLLDLCDALKTPLYEFFSDLSSEAPVNIEDITTNLYSLNQEQLKSIASLLRAITK